MERSKTVPTFYARWRINQRWRIDAEFFQLNRTGERVIDRQIQWGDQTFAVNTSVASKFNFYDLRISGGYSFFRTPDKELGIGLGLHMAWYDVSLNGPSTNGDGQDVLAPLPVLSLYGQFALTDPWAVGARLDRFSLSYGKFSGSISNLASISSTSRSPRRLRTRYRGLFIEAEVEGDRVTGNFGRPSRARWSP